MSILSVAERELRVAARKGSTYRVRLLAALIGFVISFCTLWVVTLSGATPIPGNLLFLVLSWVTFTCACLLGATLTADCISEEKREGTLGLLFLANLRGYSIALGKLASHGLIAAYSVLGVLPVIAIPLLMGGADLFSVLRTGLVLIFTLLLALTTGLFASTLSRRGWAASAFSVCIIAGLTILVPVLAPMLEAQGKPEIGFLLSLLSPSYLLSMAGWTARNLSSNHFWTALGVQSGILLSLLGATCLILKNAWRDRPAGIRSNPIRSATMRLKYGAGKGRARLRKSLLEINPILWLCARQPQGSAGFVFFLFIAGASITIGASHFHQLISGGNPFLAPIFTWLWVLPLLYIIFCFRLAVAASERFGADRKSGALELILSTPMSLREIIQGQWLGIFRQCWGGALTLLLLHAFVLKYLIDAFTMDFHAPGGIYPLLRSTVLHLAGRTRIVQNVEFYIVPLAIFAAGFLIVVLWAALGWTGMFMGLRTQKQLAAPWSALIVLGIPPFPFFIAIVSRIFYKDYLADDLFLRTFVVGVAGFSCVLGNALLWLFFCRRWVYRHMRTAATDRYQEKKRRLFRMV